MARESPREAHGPSPFKLDTVPPYMKSFVEWVKQSHPYRAVMRYVHNGGNVMAAGMSFQLLFAVFAGIWAGFAILSEFFITYPSVKQSVINFVNIEIPGLISDKGLIRPESLSASTTITVSGVIAVIVLLYTAVTWMGYSRVAIRNIFRLPPAPINVVFLKAHDFVLLLAYGLLILISAVGSVISTQLLDDFITAVGWNDPTTSLRVTVQFVGIGIVLIFDAIALGLLIRLLSGVKIPIRALFTGIVVGAIALSLMKLLANWLIGRAPSNPLFASFALLIGVLIWFNLFSRIFLITAAWVAETMVTKDIPMIDNGWVLPQPRWRKPKQHSTLRLN